MCPACQHAGRGGAFHLRSFAGGRNGEAGAGSPSGGSEAPVVMPSTAPAPAPAPQSRSGAPRNTPASSEGTVPQQHHSRPGITTALQGSTCGLKPLPGCVGGSLQGGGEFLRGGCVGLAPRSRVMAAQTVRLSCCPSTCRAGTLWVRGSCPEAEAGGEHPAANMGAASSFTAPQQPPFCTTGLPSPPKQSRSYSAG